jgi:hypothetical protein
VAEVPRRRTDIIFKETNMMVILRWVVVGIAAGVLLELLILRVQSYVIWHTVQYRTTTHPDVNTTVTHCERLWRW